MDLIGARAPYRAQPLDVPATLRALEQLANDRYRPLDLSFMFERLMQYMTEMKECIRECVRLQDVNLNRPVLTTLFQQCKARMEGGEIPVSFDTSAQHVLERIRSVWQCSGGETHHYIRGAFLQLLRVSSIAVQNPNIYERHDAVGLLVEEIKKTTASEGGNRFDVGMLEQDQDLIDLRLLANAWREQQQRRLLAMAMSNHHRLGERVDRQGRPVIGFMFQDLPSELQQNIMGRPP